MNELYLYTHNLNILIVDNNTNNIMENTELLDIIYGEIVDKQILKNGYYTKYILHN